MTAKVRRVLSIDDCDADQFLNRDTIRRSDSSIEVVTALDGEEALAHLDGAQDGIDLILVDLNMPRMNGFEFIEALAERPLEAIAIVVSSTIHPDDLARVESHPRITGFLPKPLPLDWIARIEEMSETDD